MRFTKLQPRCSPWKGHFKAKIGLKRVKGFEEYGGSCRGCYKYKHCACIKVYGVTYKYSSLIYGRILGHLEPVTHTIITQHYVKIQREPVGNIFSIIINFDQS